MTAYLYVVATPIGNLDDISERAKTTLAKVDCIFAEDTRHSSRLLMHLNIQKPLFSLHEHNEHERIALIKEKLADGQSVALISDAGTPLISDPGFQLVRSLRNEHFNVIPIPGCSALITALCVSGLATDRFCFEGFLSAKSSARKAQLQSLVNEPRTLIFYESSHRILDTLSDLCEIFGNNRQAFIGREMTKCYEDYRGDTLTNLLLYFSSHTEVIKGEFVIVIDGNKMNVDDHQLTNLKKLLSLLLADLPLKKAVAIAIQITGLKKNLVYEMALKINDTSHPNDFL